MKNITSILKPGLVIISVFASSVLFAQYEQPRTSPATVSKVYIVPADMKVNTVQMVQTPVTAKEAATYYYHDGTDGKIIITNMRGKEVKTYALPQTKGTLEIDKMSVGEYLVALWVDGNVRTREKIVIK